MKLSTLKRHKGLKFRALRKGDVMAPHKHSRYLAVVNGDDRVVAYCAIDALFDKEGNYFEEA